jgi:hypothetical protein
MERAEELALPREPKRSDVHLSRKRSGHGLGLCQNGAHVMARRGGTFEQILGKYFPGARISGKQSHGRVLSRTDSLGGEPLLGFNCSFEALRVCVDSAADSFKRTLPRQLSRTNPSLRD